MNSKRTARNQQIADLVFATIIAVIILIMIFIPGFGFITLGPISLTIVHIPVLAGAIVLGKKYGLFFGLIFGLGSFIRAFTSLSTDAPFTNPLVSVIPRVIFGFVIVYLFDAFNKLFRQKYIALPLTMGVATLIHSLMVLPLLYIVVDTKFYFFANEYSFGLDLNIFQFIWGILVLNSFVEVIGAIIIGTAVTIPLLILKEQYK